MFIKQISVVVLAIAVIGHVSANYCNCGLESGESMCSNQQSKKCSPLVVRPLELAKPILQVPKVVCTPVGGIAPLLPIPGPCSCTKAIVKPALVPRPACTACYKKTCSHSNQQSTNKVVVNEYGCQNGYGQNQAEFNYEGPKYSSGDYRPVVVDSVPSYYNNPSYSAAPADAVSLALAYKMAQKACVKNEDQLAFGFRKLPKELPPTIKKTNNIPEESLYRLNGQIVELKPVQCSGSKKSLDEEAAEELLSLSSEESYEPTEIRKVSLGDLGYKPAKIVSAPFIDVSLANPVEAADEAALRPKCKDGFVPGAVLFQTLPKPRPIVIQPEIPCDTLDEVPDVPAPLAPVQYGCGCGAPSCGCNGGYYKSSSSSSSANHATQNVLLQKLCSY